MILQLDDESEHSSRSTWLLLSGFLKYGRMPNHFEIFSNPPLINFCLHCSLFTTALFCNRNILEILLFMRHSLIQNKHSKLLMERVYNLSRILFLLTT